MVFAVNGFVFGSWASRIPDVTHQVGATHASLGGALLCLSLGALATMRPAGRLCLAVGAGPVATIGAVAVCLAAILPATANSIVVLGVALAVLGVVSGLLNVSMNTVGVELEARASRSLLPVLHAASSFGGLAGALSGGLAASWLAPTAHLLTVAALGLVTVVLAAPAVIGSRSRPPASDATAPPAAVPRSARATVVALGLIAACTAYGEGALNDWAALHLRSDLGATPVVAAGAYAGFSLAMGCGRLAAGGLLTAIGETRLLAGGAALAAVGMAIAVSTSAPALALAGFCFVGLGLANLFPLALARAGAKAGSPGVALASTLGYAGLLGGPPVIGLLAAATSLPTALGSVSVLALVAAGLAIRIRGDRTQSLLRSAWYRTAVLARPGMPLAAAALGLRLTAERHSRSFEPLDPTNGPGTAYAARRPAPGEYPLNPYPGLEHLLD